MKVSKNTHVRKTIESIAYQIPRTKISLVRQRIIFLIEMYIIYLCRVSIILDDINSTFRCE